MGKFFIPRWEVKTFSGSSAEERPLQTTSQVSDYGDQSSCIPSEWLLWSSKHVDCNVLYPDTLCTKYKQMIPCSCHPNQDAKMMLDAKKQPIDVAWISLSRPIHLLLSASVSSGFLK